MSINTTDNTLVISSSALPAGAATQTTLAAIDTKLGGTLTVGTHAVTLTSTTITGSVAVTGTFYQATQPVSIATMPTTPVTGTFYQATQPVSGTFYQATQPVSGTVTVSSISGAITLPTGAATETTLAAMNTKMPSQGQALMAASQPVVIASNQSAIPVTGTFYQATQPVSIATMPTTPVTGTFYQATQPVSGTVAVTGAYQATQPVSIATMPTTPVTGTFYQATQPVSGTVTTSPAASVISTVNSTTSNLAGAAVFTGTSEDVKDYAEIRVNVYSSHASATNGLSVQQSSDGTNWDITDTYTVSATTSIQIALPPGARYFRLVYTNGATLTTSLRIQSIFHYSATIGSSNRAADAMTNENDLVENLSRVMGYNGTTWDRLRTTGTGVLTVSAAVTALPTLAAVTTVSTVSTVSAITAILGQGAAGATAAGNPLRGALMAKTANPTAVTDGQAVNTLGDKVGRTVTAPFAVRDLVGAASITLTTTTETTLIAAVAATFNDILQITITNSSATGTVVSFRTVTAGTVVFSIYVPPGGGGPIAFPVPMKQATVNTAWTAQLGTAVTSVLINAQYIANI